MPCLQNLPGGSHSRPPRQRSFALLSPLQMPDTQYKTASDSYQAEVGGFESRRTTLAAKMNGASSYAQYSNSGYSGGSSGSPYGYSNASNVQAGGGSSSSNGAKYVPPPRSFGGYSGAGKDVPISMPTAAVEYGNKRDLFKQFGKSIGQEIPDVWRCGQHFFINDVNKFEVEEVVIVTRSSGAKTFGIVTRVCENGNLDVKVGEGEGSNVLHHKDLATKKIGKIVGNVAQIVLLPELSQFKFTESSAKILNNSVALASSRGQRECTPHHVMGALLDDKAGLAHQIITSTGCDAKGAYAAVARYLQQVPGNKAERPHVTASSSLARAVASAQSLSSSANDVLISVDQLLVAMVQDTGSSQLLAPFGLTAAAAKSAVESIRNQAAKATRGVLNGEKIEAAAAAGKEDSVLAEFATDVVQQVLDGKLDPVIGRDEEISRVVRVLSRRTKNNPVLIGEPGVGKTAIVEGLAARIVSGDVPSSLLDCRIMSLDMGALIAGAKLQGEFEERLKSCLQECSDSAGKIVLFIDEMHLVLGTGRSGDGAMDAANLLKPMLARGELRTIGATTLAEYRKYIEKDSAFERRFQQVYVGEASVDDSISILRGIKAKYEQHHGVRILDTALVAAAQLSSRYIPQRFLPDKAIDLMDEACSNVRVALDSQPDVIDQVERKLARLEIEEKILEKEGDADSKTRLEDVKAALAQTREESTTLKVRLQMQKDRISKMNEVKTAIEEMNKKIAMYEKPGNLLNNENETMYSTLIDAGQPNDKAMLNMVVNLKYSELPKLQSQYDLLEKKNDEDENMLFTETVGPDQIAEIVARWTGIPVTRLTQSEKDKILDLNDRLNAAVIGQEKTINAVSNAIVRSRAGLSSANRPTGSFLFLGPTGVGKTETARALARELFNDEKMLVRLDMSEYLEAHSVYRLIGSPPGYVGYDQGGQLTESVRRRPYSVILCDEIEKAHPQVWNCLLQLMDDGRLTDGQGRVVDFKNTVVILTSNVGAEHLLMNVEDGASSLSKEVRGNVMGMVKRVFPPEFLNRIDEIAMFSPLTETKLASILKIQFKAYTSSLEEKKITATMDDTAARTIVRSSYNPTMGARPLKRLLERVVMTSLSKLMLRGALESGTKVRITADRGILEYVVSSKYGAEQCFAEGQRKEDWVDEDFTTEPGQAMASGLNLHAR